MGAQPPPWVLETAASKADDFTAFDHSGAAHRPRVGRDHAAVGGGVRRRRGQRGLDSSVERRTRPAASAARYVKRKTGVNKNEINRENNGEVERVP